jgi:hypothetical protein
LWNMPITIPKNLETSGIGRLDDDAIVESAGQSLCDVSVCSVCLHTCFVLRIWTCNRLPPPAGLHRLNPHSIFITTAK